MNEPVKSSAPWPLSITIKTQARQLVIAFDDGKSFSIAFELLRVESPSAEVQGHSAGQKVLVRNKADVKIVRVEPVGRYAVRLVFDDGHNSGLYTWDWLYRLGRDQEGLMRAYRAAVQ